LGLNFSATTHPEEHTRLLNSWSEARKDNGPAGLWRLMSKGGDTRVWDIRTRLHFEPGFHLWSARDVTARKLPLPDSDLWRRAFDSLELGVVLTDHAAPDNPIIYVNPAGPRLLGYTSDELIGKNCRVLQGPHRDQPALEEVRQALREGRACIVEMVNRRKNGEDWLNLLSLAPIRDECGTVTHYVGVQTDVTHLRNTSTKPRKPAPTTGSRPAVLLVDDEEAVREFIRIVLTQGGYSVFSVADARQALELFRTEPERFSLVLSDVRMPGRSGIELAADLRAITPEVPIVFMSGFTGSTVGPAPALPPGALVLEKPFTLDTLLKTVKAAIQP
jgi:PAS domain S-box-containing protein